MTKFQRPSNQDLRGMFLRSSEVVIKDAQERFSTHGISWFSEVNDELLMWSHYGGKNKGFCLVLQGQNLHVRLWKGLRSTTEFKVQFEEFA